MYIYIPLRQILFSANRESWTGTNTVNIIRMLCVIIKYSAPPWLTAKHFLELFSGSCYLANVVVGVFVFCF